MPEIDETSESFPYNAPARFFRRLHPYHPSQITMPPTLHYHSPYQQKSMQELAKQEAEQAVIRLVEGTVKLSKFPDLADERLQDMDFATMLRFFRLRRGLTGADLAKLMALHPSEISRYERGSRYPSPCRLKMLCERLQLSLVEKGLLETELMKRMIGRQSALHPKSEQEREFTKRHVTSSMRLLLSYVTGLPARVSVFRLSRLAKELQERQCVRDSAAPTDPILDAMASKARKPAATKSQQADLTEQLVSWEETLKDPAVRQMMLQRLNQTVGDANPLFKGATHET